MAVSNYLKKLHFNVLICAFSSQKIQRHPNIARLTSPLVHENAAHVYVVVRVKMLTSPVYLKTSTTVLPLPTYHQLSAKLSHRAKTSSLCFCSNRGLKKEGKTIADSSIDFHLSVCDPIILFLLNLISTSLIPLRVRRTGRIETVNRVQFKLRTRFPVMMQLLHICFIARNLQKGDAKQATESFISSAIY